MKVLSSLHKVSTSNIHITKRDLFYTDVKLFVDQGESDAVLDDLACMIGCTRSNLYVVASNKSLVIGRIQFTKDGNKINCTRIGDAKFVLLVEKEAAYMRLAEDRLYH